MNENEEPIRNAFVSVRPRDAASRPRHPARTDVEGRVTIVAETSPVVDGVLTIDVLKFAPR